MFWLIKKMFMGLLINVVNASNHTKYISLRNEKCEIQPTFINLHHNKYSQEFWSENFLVIKKVKLKILYRRRMLLMILMEKNLFNSSIDKKRQKKISEYFPTPNSLEKNLKVELDLSNYATKTDLKIAKRVDTSSFA